MSDVSIILPVADSNDRLSPTLESILKSNYQNLEVVIVLVQRKKHLDNFSDFELRFARAGHRLLVVYSPKEDLGSILNFGISLSAREFICLIDLGDLMLEDRIDLQVAYLKANPNVAAVGGQILYMDSIRKHQKMKSHYPTNPHSTRSDFDRGCPVAHQTVMYRRAEIVALGGYRNHFKSAEDLDLWLRVLDVRDISNLNEYMTICLTDTTHMKSVTSDFKLYRRVAYQSRELRRSGVQEDLPDRFDNLDDWLSRDSGVYKLKKLFNRHLAFKYNEFYRHKLIELKSARRNRRYLLVVFLFICLSLIMPKKLVNEFLSFLKFRLKH
jgi:glycosyltransferase involved in cell wall biosynthesis